MSDAANSTKPKPLTHRQVLFVSEYLLDKNGAAAAERAGYSAKFSAQTAYHLLRDKRIQALIDQVFEMQAMRASEAVALLTMWARGNMKHFLTFSATGAMTINLGTEEAQQHLHLLKKVKQRRRVTKTDFGEIEEITTEIELYDAKDAVHKILQLLGKYPPQRIDHTTNGKTLPAGPPANIYVPDNARSTSFGGGSTPPVTD